VIDGLYDAVSEPDVAGSCTRSFLCGQAFPLIPILLTLIGFVAGFIICRTVSAHLRQRRLERKYEIIKAACAHALKLTAEGRHADGFNQLIRRIREELPAILHSLGVLEAPVGIGAPVGAKTTADYSNAHLGSEFRPPLGAAFAELFSAELVAGTAGNPPTLGRAPKALAIPMHTLSGCHPVDTTRVRMGFEAVESTYPVLKPNEMAPITHTPAVIPPQPLATRDERKFLRLVGQTTVMITVDLDGFMQVRAPATPVVCSCGNGQLTRLFPGPANIYPTVDYTVRGPDEQNRLIHQAISDFQKAWTAQSSPNAQFAGLSYMIKMAKSLN